MYIYIYISVLARIFCERSGMCNRSRRRSLHMCATGTQGRQRRPYLGGSGGMPLRKIFKV